MTDDRRNRNMVLFLGPDQLKGLINMDEAVAAVEQGYREAAEHPIGNAPRRRVHSPDGVRVSNFPGGVPGMGVIGSLTRTESVTHDPKNQEYPYREHPVYVLWDSHSARLLSIMVGEIFDDRTGFSSIMALRTAATTGVGVKHLSREDSKIVGLFGSGGQALNKLLAIKAVRDINEVRVYSRNPENRKKFAEHAEKLVGVNVTPVDSPEAVIKGADMVVCATNSNVPVFDGHLLEPGQHVVTIVGSNTQLVQGGWISSGRRENDDETVRRADVIATNWVESVFQDQQAGLYEPLQKGIITAEDIIGIGDIAAGLHPGRTGAEQITMHFNNNGTAAADIAIAKICYDRAKAEGRGQELDIPVPGTQFD
ncbi:MAG: hypothetical protein RLZ98_1759 [Pseudomonadota bacterium]|jgi:alanine dehydrogenase